MKVVNVGWRNISDEIIEEELTDDGCGVTVFDGVKYSHCFSCGNSTKVMIRLVEINDDCLDDYLCTDCLKKIMIVCGEQRQ